MIKRFTIYQQIPIELFGLKKIPKQLAGVKEINKREALCLSLVLSGSTY
jgi:hypothetical protein